MIRSLHKIPGLVSALLVTILALSGAMLSLYPAAEKLATPDQSDPALSVGTLAERVAASYPGVEQIRRAPSGQITTFYFDNDKPFEVVINPATGQGVAPAERSALRRWITNLHRSLFLDDTGRIAMAIGALSMLVLSISGLALTLRRVGGVRRYFSSLQGPISGRLHVEIARIAVAGLILSSVTALWMTASTFGFLPEVENVPPFPADVSGETGFAPNDMPELRALPVSSLRELVFPYPGDASDVFTLKTNTGEGFLDQGTGQLLAWSETTGWARVNELIRVLHTGEGAWLLGLVLGVLALGVPAMAGTGVILWLQGRRSQPRLRGNSPVTVADTIVLVGSEGGSTWGFAATLQMALSDHGHRVHVAPMSRFAPERYAKAERIVLLAATYGDGAAPASALGFLQRLAALPQAPDVPLAIVGFGDRQFPHFCAYAQEVANAATAKGWQTLVPIVTVDRQSPQDFACWGRALGAVLDQSIDLQHHPLLPCTQTLTLLSRRDYGREMQAPTAILRFALPPRSLMARMARMAGRTLPNFAAGDLLGIIPEQATLPRFYSLASSSRDGFAEICVKRHTGGLCSNQLMDLVPGQKISAFIRRNPDFRPASGRTPLILIGAGTGIGPLAGFARANLAARPMHLYFGIRHPESDYLYETEISEWLGEGHLASVTTASSRTSRCEYVQDSLRRDGEGILRLMEQGAQVLVCGGRGMAAGVAATLTDILTPAGLTLATLKAGGRYVEDVY